MVSDKNSFLISRALLFAEKAHRGTFRKGTNIPYIVHPVEAALIVASLSSEPELIAAALLHDTVEDTAVTLDELRREFGDRVADLVADETVVDNCEICTHDSWHSRKEETLRHLASASTDAKLVAIGDKLANMRAIYRDYRELGDKLWDRFNVSDPAEQGWYYFSLAGALSSLSRTPAWQEYVMLVKNVFADI